MQLPLYRPCRSQSPAAARERATGREGHSGGFSGLGSKKGGAALLEAPASRGRVWLRNPAAVTVWGTCPSAAPRSEPSPPDSPCPPPQPCHLSMKSGTVQGFHRSRAPPAGHLGTLLQEPGGHLSLGVHSLWAARVQHPCTDGGRSTPWPHTHRGPEQEWGGPGSPALLTTTLLPVALRVGFSRPSHSPL